MTIRTTIFVILLVAVPLFLRAQCIAVAGSDITKCSHLGDSIQLGGDPTVTGGVPPYQYKWSNISTDDNSLTGLNLDSTLANPWMLLSREVNLLLTVTDKYGSTCKDTIRIAVQSGYSRDLLFRRRSIQRGDSVQLDFGIVLTSIGRPPYKTEWNPKRGLSNAFVSNPMASPDDSTTYVVTIRDSVGCKYQDEFIVSVADPLSAHYKGSDRLNCFMRGDNLHIITALNPDDIGTVRLYNMNGELIRSKEIFTSSSTIGCSDLAPGYYQVVFLSNQLFQRKIMFIR